MKPLSEHPGKPATGHAPARANPKDERTATQLLTLASHRITEEEREELKHRIASLIGDGSRPVMTLTEEAEAILSILLPGPEEEGNDDD